MPAILRSLLIFTLVALLGGLSQAAETTPPGYAFALPPLEMYDLFLESKLDERLKLATEERELLDKIWPTRRGARADRTKATESTLLEAMLFASGVADAKERQTLRTRYDGVAKQAATAVKRGRTSLERGEQLMQFLHKGVMKHGYVAEQSSLSDVFKSGKFNCVSATAMYHLVGTRLGLKLQPITIPGEGSMPGHATLDMLEGNRRIQVEATNADGFDIDAKLKRPGAYTIGFVPDRSKGKDSDDLGIAAAIYSNRGVGLSKEEPTRYADAICCYLAALTLDPLDDAATNNLKAALNNWSGELAKTKKFDHALRVLAFGLKCAPQSKELLNNRRAASTLYIEALIDQGKDAEAMKVAAEAAAVLPDEEHFRDGSYWFIVLGQRHLKENEWPKALAMVDRGIKVVSAADQKRLLDWRTSAYRHWSQTLLDKADPRGSLAVLTRAYAADPSDASIKDGITYHAQESLRLVEKTDGATKMVEHFNELCKAFPGVESIAERGVAHAQQAVLKLTSEKKFAEAAAAAKSYEPLLTTAEDRAELGALAYDSWAMDLAESKKWSEAVDRYLEGLKAYPGQKRLSVNVIVTIDRWASGSIEAKNWAEAIRVYKLGLERFPGDAHLTQNLKYCEQQASR